MQCEYISYKFGVYIYEIKKQVKSVDCHECTRFSQAHLHEHNINENKYKQNKQL